MLTAVLGALIFSESLPGIWWIGAAMLVTGSVIIGRRDEGNKVTTESGPGNEPLLVEDESVFRDRDEEDEASENVELTRVERRDESNDDEDGILK
jgi:hypothetical protein